MMDCFWLGKLDAVFFSKVTKTMSHAAPLKEELGSESRANRTHIITRPVYLSQVAGVDKQ